jgi:hypothetical protein
MTDRRQLLEEALSTGRQELKHLMAGEVDEARDLSGVRCSKAEEAIHGLDRDGLNLMAEQLYELDRLQTELTAEAKKLKDRVQAELQGFRKQSKRFAGYKLGAGYLPPEMQNARFVSKKG